MRSVWVGAQRSLHCTPPPADSDDEMAGALCAVLNLVGRYLGLTESASPRGVPAALCG
ncbi:hypothetical protein [Spirillospora sp. NPDC047279]|uniref:hypothetical protein n=1 Tax=Spirillospora sp. NPDC047279 TaxID=3155478 RepID=UPI0033C35B28